MAHNLPNGIVAPLKDNPDEGYEQDIDINADSLAANGFYPQNATSHDGAAGMYRDANGNLVLKDEASGAKTLSQLLSQSSGGGGSVSFAAPVDVSTANAEGTASTVARSDHVHAHGSLSGGSLHSAATTGAAGFMSSTDKTKLDSVTVANIPSADEKAALAGTQGSPSGTNKYVTDTDTRLSNARAPSAHATSHAAEGSDPVTLSQSQITNLTTDLAGKVPTTRSVTAGTGLSGGGALSTDVTLSLADAGTAGTYGSASQVPVLTTDAKGRVTGVTNTSIAIAQAAVTNLTTDLAGKASTATTISAGTGLSGGGDLSANRTISMPAVGTAGTYGSASSVPVITTDTQGRVSGVTATSIAIAQSAVTNLVADLAAKAADSAVVHLTGNESVGGVKTFSSSPSVPTPSSSGDAANKSYVDTQVSAVSGSYAAPVQDVTALRAFASTSLADKQLRLVEDKGALYRYDTAATGSDDGDGTVTPTDNPATGRWYKIQAATQVHNDLSGLQGGTTNDYQHLTTAQLGTLTGATDANTASAIVKRDASGNFTAGTITATTFSGALSGNASTATKLSSARALALTGDITGSVSSDLTSGASIATTHGSLSGASMHAAATTGANGFMSSADKTKLDAATNANTGSTLVMRDASGNFTAGTITAALTGNADTATKLSASKTFALTGDVTGSVSSDLTTGPSIATTLASVGAAGTYGSASQVPVLTTDAKGRVTGVTNTSIAIAQAAVTNLTTDLSNRPTGSGTAGHVAYWSGASALTGESNLFWDATNDRLGIGTASPSVKLQVHGSAPQFLVLDPSTGSFGQFLSYDLGGGNRPTAIRVSNDGSATTTDVMTFLSSGNVGIGTASPGAQLQQYAASGTTYRQITNGSNNVTEYVSTAVSAAAYGTTNSIPLLFTTNNSERMRIEAGGNVGIGTASPGSAFKLDVAGVHRNTGLVIDTGGIYGFNLHYSGGWKYAGNGYGATWVHNNTGGIDLYTASNNTSGAGASASLSGPLVTFASNGNVTTTGSVTAASFSGSGAGLTDISVSLCTMTAVADEALSVGDIVCLNSAGSSLGVLKASSTTVSKSYVVGICLSSAASSANVTVGTFGLLTGYAVSSGMTKGGLYYLGPSGTLVAYDTFSSGDRVVLMGYAVSATELFLRIQDLGYKP